MAQFDPAERLEWWQFQQIGEQRGKPVYKRLKYNEVSYDNDVTRYIEPVSSTEWCDQTVGFQIRAQQPTLYCRIAGFEFHNGRPYSVFSYDDNVSLDGA